MNIESIRLIRSACHYLLQALEVLNLLDDDSYRELIMKCRTKRKHLMQISVNAERGSAWMTIFFLLELLDEIADEPIN